MVDTASLADVHAHLTHSSFRDRLPEVVAEATRRGVSAIVVNGLNPRDNERVRALAAAHPTIRPAFGFYPVDTVLRAMLAAGVDYPREEEPADPEEGVAWVEAHAREAFAIGEIGLDGYWVPEAFWPAQEQVFRALLRIARREDKPVILHSRKREAAVLAILQEEGIRRADFHCFGGKLKLARQVADAGFYLSIPANCRRSQSFTRMLETLPRDRLLLETDCPYLGPEPGTASQPADVADTAEFAATLWGVSVASAREQFAANYQDLFNPS